MSDHSNYELHKWNHERNEQFNLLQFLERKREWSLKTFGPDYRTETVLAHIRKELFEIEAKPDDPEEWIDLINLAIDGAQRRGVTDQQIIQYLLHKQDKNEKRSWPDWRAVPQGVPIEHEREAKP